METGRTSCLPRRDHTVRTRLINRGSVKPPPLNILWSLTYYVYAHLNPISLKPFYIGKGKGNRWYSTQDRSNWWGNYTAKHGFIPKILVDGLSNKDACEIEKQYISRYGFKKAGGLLINQTAGGEGGNTFDPIGGKNWNSGKTGIYKPEAIEKLRQSRIGKKLPEDVKAKVLAGLKKAAAKSLESRTHKVRCLVTGKVWNNRRECMSDLGFTLSTYSNRIYANKPIKGNHLQLIK